MSAGAVAGAGYKLLRRSASQGISSNLRPGELTVRLQSAGGGLGEDEYQFHTIHSPNVVTVEDRGSLVRSVEVQI